MKPIEQPHDMTTYALGYMPIVSDEPVFYDKHWEMYVPELLPYTTGRVFFERDNGTGEWSVATETGDCGCEQLSSSPCPVCAITEAIKKARFNITWYDSVDSVKGYLREAEEVVWGRRER
ncbi:MULTISPECIES: hypothetical protein [unclassified Adlercreutzia]|uniref:hypothetical protein n=1 Tax=unclassified Adlercreutzia TaxID=2636013 RepID=UPI0013EC5D8A|nr:MULTISPECIES: hypothetical protein [unclassified Adlercreutzia]